MLGLRETGRGVFGVIEPEDRPRLYLGLVLGAVGGLTEIGGIAGIYPFFALLGRPELVRTNPWLARAYALGGFSNERSFILAFGAAALACFLAASAFLFLRQAYIIRFCLRQTGRVATRLMRSYLFRPYEFFLDTNSAVLAKNVVSQSDTFGLMILLPWMNAVSETFVIAALGGAVAWIDWRLGLAAALLFGLPIALIQSAIRRGINQFSDRLDASNGRRFSEVIETLQSIKEIKTAGREDFFWRRFETPAASYAALLATGNVLQIVPSVLIQTVAVGAMMILALGLYVSGRPAAEIVPLLTGFAVAGFRMMPSVSRMTNALTQMRQYGGILESLRSDLAAVAIPAAETAAGAPAPRLRESLELKGAVFAYRGARGGRRVLDGVDLRVAPRSFVSLVGGSGAGKTTLVDVLMGLLPLDEGEVRLDGAPLSPERLRAWRRRVGYIPQSLLLSDSSAASNVAFGLPDSEIDRERVRTACRLANLDAVIEALPEGYDTRIGERGSKLSGGQRQRLGIARALYHDPDLLILDESTSALDGIAEAEIVATLRELKKTKAILVIAHRPSLVRASDEVLLMKDGRIAERGDYDSLVAREPHFAALMAHAEEP